MEFNLKQHVAKKAAAGNLNTTTEGQLDNKGKAPSSLSEVQLNKSRSKSEPDVIAEKQLDKARAKKDAPTSTTEAQLPQNGKEPTTTGENQLEGNRPGGSTAPVEKRLDNVRSATFNLKDFMAKQAAKKKDKADQVTEGQLGERGKKEPKDLTDAQLDKGRKDTRPVTTQALLEKARTGEADKLVEARLDSSDSKLMKHRNPEASKGDIPKLEEQRLKSKKIAEGEKYEPASTTDKNLMLPKVDGKDGLKTASAGFWQTKMAQAMPTSTNPQKIDDALHARFPSSTETAAPAEEPLEEADDKPLVYEDDSQDVNVGQTTMKQITIRFDNSQLVNEKDALDAVTSLLLSMHPSLRTHMQSGGLDLSKSISLDMEEGKATAMMPSEVLSSSPVV
jgi:hypothetical protein